MSSATLELCNVIAAVLLEPFAGPGLRFGANTQSSPRDKHDPHFGRMRSPAKQLIRHYQVETLGINIHFVLRFLHCSQALRA